MKLKAKKSDFKGAKILCVGYCELQYLLRGREEIAYTSGVYGWNADIYDIGGFLIVSGYRPFGERLDYELLKSFEERARAIWGDYSKSYETRKQEAETLLARFIDQVKDQVKRY